MWHVWGRGVYRVFVGKSEGKKPLETPRRRWEYNIKMDLQGIRWWDVNWLDPAQDRNKWLAAVNTVMNRLVL
jgi:hypothetical protein